MTTDIKAAFLQGRNIEHDVYMKPPIEVKKDGKIWKLKKVVYGLNDAARNWFHSVRRRLLELGCLQSKYDHALFYWYNNDQLMGIFFMHVDDFLHAGCLDFNKNIISKVQSYFKVRMTAEMSFSYVGLNI